MLQALMDMHTNAIFRIEERQSTYILILSILCGGWATIIAGLLQKDEAIIGRATMLGFL